jgi:NAD(P)-dependent dehydrogenase (short-subunit alcohol dehydrogenase family)
VSQIRFRIEACRGTACQNASALARGAQALHPGVSSDIVDNDIDAALVREVADLLIKIFLGIVDQEVRAELLRALEFGVCAGGGEDAASHHLRDLEGCCSDTGSYRENEHVFSGLQLSLVHHHAPRRERDERRGGRVFKAESVRNGKHDMCGNFQELRVTSVALFTDHGERVALASVAGSAEFAVAATDSGIDRHSRSSRESADSFADRSDNSRGIAAGNEREGKTFPRDSFPNPEVDMVDRGGTHLNEDFVCSGCRVGGVLVPQRFEAAVLMNDDGFHDACSRTGIMAFIPMDISGKVALITGSSKRIGRETTIELARRGAQVAIHYRSDEAGARETLRLASEAGGKGEVFHAELTEAADVEKMFADVEKRFGGLDILVNNASVFDPGVFEDATPELWSSQMDSNAKAPFFIAQRAAALMNKRGAGKIVNLVDVAGEVIWPGYLAYSISKAALIAVNRGLAKALAPAIQVNGIAPGPVLFPEYYTQDQKHLAIERTLLKRPGSARDIVNAVVFLIENDYITGEVIHVDGGRHLM